MLKYYLLVLCVEKSGTHGVFTRLLTSLAVASFLVVAGGTDNFKNITKHNISKLFPTRFFLLEIFHFLRFNWFFFYIFIFLFENLLLYRIIFSTAFHQIRQSLFKFSYDKWKDILPSLTATFSLARITSRLEYSGNFR